MMRKLIPLLLIVLGCTIAYAEDSENVERVFNQADLDQMLAPIALYPDTVLSHILIASTYPLEVVQAERWLSANDTLSAANAVKAVEQEDWDPSIKALISFPQIVTRMSEDLTWTQNLGDAFLQDEERVLQSIQNLRKIAYAEGNLNDLKHLEISQNNDAIVIEPRSTNVVYVPYYDSRLVYGPWWWANSPPVYWGGHRRANFGYNPFSWGPRIHLGSSFYFGSFQWDRHQLVVINNARSSHHRYRSGRNIARHADASRWRHNPRHRRGVAYQHSSVRNNYAITHSRSVRNHAGRRQEGHSRVKERLNAAHGNRTQIEHNKATNNLNHSRSSSNTSRYESEPNVFTQDSNTRSSRSHSRTNQQKGSNASSRARQSHATGRDSSSGDHDKSVSRTPVYRNGAATKDTPSNQRGSHSSDQSSQHQNSTPSSGHQNTSNRTQHKASSKHNSRPRSKSISKHHGSRKNSSSSHRSRSKHR